MKVFARRDPPPILEVLPTLEFTPHFGDLRSAVIPTWVLLEKRAELELVLQEKRAELELVLQEKRAELELVLPEKRAELELVLPEKRAELELVLLEKRAELGFTNKHIPLLIQACNLYRIRTLCKSQSSDCTVHNKCA